jgi:hypothetical protein
MTVVFSTTRTRGPDLTILLEVAGLDLEPSLSKAHYVVFLPKQARLRDGQGSGPYDGDWRWTEGDEYIVWQGTEPVALRRAEARQMLFGLAELAGAQASEVLEFVRNWGLISAPSTTDAVDQAAYLKAFWACPVSAWSSLAEDCSLILHLFADTASNREAAEDLLEPLFDQFLSDPPDEYVKELPSGVHMKKTEWFQNVEQVWADEKRFNRLALQKRLLAGKVNDFLSGFERRQFVWENTERRFEHSAMGVWEIVQAELADLLVAPEVGVYICSMCDRVYEMELSGDGRRPRAGVRNFCSDECRAKAKRESNRQSWHRHSETWRPPGSRSKRRDSDGKA